MDGDAHNFRLYTHCAHCGEALAQPFSPELVHAASPLAFEFEGRWVAVCCVGCRAAMAFSSPVNVSDYAVFSDWDRVELLEAAERFDDGSLMLCFAIDAIHCPNCAWLIETTLLRSAPELEITCDVPLRLLHLRFNPRLRPLSHIVADLSALGYPARLVTRQLNDRSAKRKELKQLFIAGFCAVQAMMFAEPLYWTKTDLPLQTALFFAWLSALITLPVVAYCGARFLRGAITEMRLRRPAMDTLISASIFLALAGSFVGLIQGQTRVYFDAIAMFIFVLLLGRMLESSLMARARAQATRLNGVVPELAERDSGERVAVSSLKMGDRLRATVGSTLVADGILVSETSAFSEALLDGESRPKKRRQGERVYAGASVYSVDDTSGECIYVVAALGEHTELAQIARLSRFASAARIPNAAQEAQLATRFTLFVLVLAILTALAWWLIAPERALAVTLSVLTVACPCALGLALPLTRAVAHARLQSFGVLLLKPDALERLNRVDCALLDKTGTLTELMGATPSVRQIVAKQSAKFTEVDALTLACALEQGQSHPIAAAFLHAGGAQPELQATQIEVLPGQGVRGSVDGQTWTLGSPLLFGLPDNGDIVLDGAIGRAHFAIDECLRPGAAVAVAELQALGLTLEILSGDSAERVKHIAGRLNIARAQHRLTPSQKREKVQAANAAGRFPMMLGDGINDAIALASAHVAVTFGSASGLAHAQADVLVLAQDLRVLPEIIRVAKRSNHIARQNLRWAQSYNLVFIPLAALGFIGPGLAALGMALSSLIVTGNAARLWPWRAGSAANFDVMAEQIAPIALATNSSTP